MLRDSLMLPLRGTLPLLPNARYVPTMYVKPPGDITSPETIWKSKRSSSPPPVRPSGAVASGAWVKMSTNEALACQSPGRAIGSKACPGPAESSVW